MPYPAAPIFPSASLFPGVDVGALTWDNSDERYFQHGVDRGVLYPSVEAPVVWNGITGVDESSDSSQTIYYIDGRIYLADVEPGDFKGSLTAYFWPDAFSECLGIPDAGGGLFVDNQKPQRCGISYRSLIGSGTDGDMFGYQIHLVYNAVPTIGNRSRKTINSSPAPMEFQFDLVCTPVALPGFRPSAHYIIDTRHMSPENLATLEAILYGSEDSSPRLPEPLELYDLLNFGSSIIFTDHGDGTWTATGSSSNIYMTGDGTWEIINVNGTDNGDGTYELEDTP